MPSPDERCGSATGCPRSFATTPQLLLAAVVLGSRQVVTQSRDLLLRALDPLISLIATLVHHVSTTTDSRIVQV
jgi:hypothetical protein